MNLQRNLQRPMRTPPTEKEMQEVYLNEFLPLLRKDREEREKQLVEKKQHQQAKKRWEEHQKKLTRKISPQQQKVVELLNQAKREAKKERKEKEKERRKFTGTYVPTSNLVHMSAEEDGDSEEEEIEVEEDLELKKKLLEVARSDKPIFKDTKRKSRWDTPPMVKPVEVKPKKSRWDVKPEEPVKPVKKSRWDVPSEIPNLVLPMVGRPPVVGRPPMVGGPPVVGPPKVTQKLSLSEFHKTVEKDVGHPECPSLFVFDIKSKHLPPGKAKGEKVDETLDFHRLSRVNDWRKKLSNFWKAPFDLDGKKWQTVQHYLEAQKFKNNLSFYNQFSLDSSSEMSHDPVMAKYAGSKSGMYKGKRIRPEGVEMIAMTGKVDVDKALKLASYAKFSQNEHLRLLLLDTQNACLFEDKPQQRAIWLEKTRDALNMLKEKHLPAPKIG